MYMYYSLVIRSICISVSCLCICKMKKKIEFLHYVAFERVFKLHFD